MKLNDNTSQENSRNDISELLLKEQLHQVMLDISDVVNTSQTLTSLYSSIFELLRNSVLIKNFAIALHSQKENQISFPFYVDEKAREFTARATGKYLEEYVLTTATLQFFTKFELKNLVKKGDIEEQPLAVEVWLGIPLTVQNTVIGVLAVYDYSNKNIFGKNEIAILKYAATQISLAVERKLAFLAIQEHELNLRTLIENTEDAIWSLDTNFDVITFNSSAKAIFAQILQLELTEGLNLKDSMKKIERSEWLDLYSRAFKNERFSITKSYPKGDNYLELHISFNPIVNDAGLVTGVSVFVKNITELKREENERKIRTEHILNNQRVLTELAKKEYDSLESALLIIASHDARTLNTERVSIWTFTESRNEIICEASAQRNSTTNLKGAKLSSVDYPTYFKALETSHAVVADDARINPLTKEFTESYLIPHGITSMMDTPIHLHGKVIGIVCHEHIGPARKWTLEEQEFATSIAELVSIAFETSKRKIAESSLTKLGHALRSISECVCITDMENKIIFVNKAFTNTYEYSEEELIGNDISSFHYEANGDGHVKEIFDKTLSGGWQGEVLNKKRDGTVFTSHLSTSIIRNEKGEPIALIGVSNNIEERKKSEKLIRESEQRFRILTETVESAIIIYQNEGYVYANPAAERLLGYSKEELYGMKFWEVVHPDFRELIRQRGLARQKGENIPSRYEFKILSKNGIERWIDFAAAVINYQGVQAVLGTAFDITERKRGENLQSAVFRIAQAAEGATDLTELFKAVHTIVGEVMYAKNFYIALFDKKANTVSFPYFVDEEDEPPQPQQARRGLTEWVMRNGKSLLSTIELHEELVRKGEIETIGSMSPIWLGVPLIIGKETIGVMTVQHYSDAKVYGETEQQMLEYVSTQVAKAIEQKRTEDLLRANEKRFRTLIENSSDVVVMLDRQGTILYESPAVLPVLGFTSESRAGKSIFEKIHPDDTHDLIKEFKTLVEKPQQSSASTFRVRHNNGTWRWIEAIGTNLLNDSNIQAIVANYRDVTERKNAVESLRDSEERFRSLFESATDAIFTVSLQGIFTSLNPAFEKITGWHCSEWLGKSFTTILHNDDIPLANRLFQETMNEKRTPAYELRVKTKNEEYFIGEITSTPQIQNNKVVGMLGIARDITERKKMEEEIRYIQKMESIGILAGGVAHDFNNILAIINAYTGSLKLIKNPPEQLLHNVDIIEKTVRRGARVVQQLLTLAKKTDPVFELITINPLIEELGKLLQEAFPKTISFKTELNHGDAVINADSNQLYQVLLNLSLNARDAMPDGGTLTILSQIVQAERLKNQFPDVNEELYLHLSINDTGTGMDKKIKERMFEPFFTTKDSGRGTGLGLSIVFSIIENHRGFVHVDSALNQGTTFHIYIPVPSDNVLKDTEEIVNNQEINGGNETLLLVEDEESLLDLMAGILENSGYRIIKANDGEEAMRLFDENKDEIKLVLTDMGLPKIGGFEAFQKMKAIKPGVKVILASGYLDSKVRSQMLEAGAEDFVQKPYDLIEIMSRIREILDNSK